MRNPIPHWCKSTFTLAEDLAQSFISLPPPPVAFLPLKGSVKSLQDGILLCFFNAILAQA